MVGRVNKATSPFLGPTGRYWGRSNSGPDTHTHTLTAYLCRCFPMVSVTSIPFSTGFDSFPEPLTPGRRQTEGRMWHQELGRDKQKARNPVTSTRDNCDSGYQGAWEDKIVLC